uniref:Uridine-cytidine kinase 1-like 1a n=1 Tax=Sinocyclocheilus grahami TaxID=75366 RepID=A0A672P4B3_SINGR
DRLLPAVSTYQKNNYYFILIPCVAVKAHMVIGQDCDLSGVCVAPTSDQTCNLYVTHLQVLSPEEQTLAASNDYNFDHPGAFDFELLVTTLRKLKQGKSVKMPVYDFTTHGRQKDWKNVYGASVIIFEGILSFADKELLQQYIETHHVTFINFSPSHTGGGNMVAIDLIVQHVHSQLEEREISSQPLPQTLSVLESTPQVRGLHTIIKNKDTSCDEFIFYSKRLMRLLIEHALYFLPSKVCGCCCFFCVCVCVPLSVFFITGVSVLWAGETMEPALRAVSILLHYLRLPRDISEDHVILMDSTVSTGAAAMMAVRVLLIVLVSLLMAELGVHSVAYAFPRVKIITTAVDKSLDDLFHVIPGIGDFGDCYFGTDGAS